MNIGDNPAKLYLLKVKQSQLSQPLTLSDAPVSETYLWAFSAFSPVDPCLSCTGDPKTGSRTLGVISQLLNREGRSPSSNLLASLFALQPWVGSWEHCLLMLNLLSNRNGIYPSLSSCFPDGQPQTCSGVWCRIWHLPLLNILSLLSVHFSSLLRCPWVVADHLLTQLPHKLLLPVVSCVQTCWGGTAPSPTLLVKTLSSTGPCVTSCGWPLVTGLQMKFLQRLSSFSVHLNVHFS